ncbi:hypothetical protein L207DRAFT_444545 [Hyaloscypha variabilis F]|uniref:Uncharacterized protein n=1 Tax=Hyaloscypha variabilis (strain UAMH 11265 / GT02V1 / F) TaxID=1149755 RepID=A0A2J6QUH3_HYAVF|nr:hypothetical protein L207DRAFT_444545 [Hyaloscypha variabilis F]
MIVEGAKDPPSLNEVVDLSNTVDTDETTKTMPAVTHEKIVPTRHEIREERITREIHTHDVFHRILPVIETEILPPKHYVPSADGKGLIEIPEHMVPGRTANGSPSRNWEITPSQQSRIRSKSLTSSNGQYTHPDIHEDDSAEGPVISYTRGESKANHSRVNSRTSTLTSKSSISKNILEPILSSKKEYIAKEGHPKTEYVWRHPGVFETATGETQPIYMGAGLGDLSLPRPKTAPSKATYSDDEEEDTAGAEFGAMRRSPVGEEEFLFRDSGYGSGGMLPGLRDKTPLAGLSGEPRFIPEDFEVIRLGRVVGNEAGENRKGRDISEGEATRALMRIREKRKSSEATSVASTIRANERENSVDAVERGVRGLNMRD